MENNTDSPGVYIPPPLFYILIFLAAVFMQKGVPIDNSLFHVLITKLAGILFILGSLFFIITAFSKFFKSKNTVILIKPASSLQTDGIYHISRNPMYVGMGFIYIGLTCLLGNWWNMILFPILLIIIQEYVIKSEENYLGRAFGEKYLEYKKNVRRWL